MTKLIVAFPNFANAPKASTRTSQETLRSPLQICTVNAVRNVTVVRCTTLYGPNEIFGTLKRVMHTVASVP